MPANLDPQLALDEKAITDPDLEAALERRLRAKDDVAEVRGVYKRAHTEVQAAIALMADFEPDTAIRIGRFRITKRHVEGRTVTFGTEARDQISIGLVDEDGAPARRSARAIKTGTQVALPLDDVAPPDVTAPPENGTDAPAASGQEPVETFRQAPPAEPTPIRPSRKASSHPPSTPPLS